MESTGNGESENVSQVLAPNCFSLVHPRRVSRTHMWLSHVSSITTSPHVATMLIYMVYVYTYVFVEPRFVYALYSTLLCRMENSRSLKIIR